MIPDEVLYTVTCSNCSTIFEFSQREAKTNYPPQNTSDPREYTTYLSIPCPTCQNHCSAALMSPAEYLRKKAAAGIQTRTTGKNHE